MDARSPFRDASTSLRRVLEPRGRGVAYRCGGDRPNHDVLAAGGGTREGKAVTRCSSALRGRELGGGGGGVWRCRGIRSLCGWTWAATLKWVRITVEGWA